MAPKTSPSEINFIFTDNLFNELIIFICLSLSSKQTVRSEIFTDLNSAIFFKDVFPTNVSIYGIQYSDGSDYLNLPYVGDIDAPNGPTGSLGLEPFLNYEFTPFPEILPP
jgi:hypothetical protein